MYMVVSQPFPVLFGGEVGETTFHAFDVDGNGNIVAGGSSADTSIVS